MEEAAIDRLMSLAQHPARRAPVDTSDREAPEYAWYNGAVKENRGLRGRGALSGGGGSTDSDAASAMGTVKPACV